MSAAGSRLARVVRRRFDGRTGTLGAWYRWRRLSLMWRLRWHAWLVRSTVDAQIAPGTVVGRRVRVEIGPRTTSVVRLGPGCRLGNDVLLELKGGVIDFGREVELRTSTRLNVAGNLVIPGPTIFGEQCSVHCRTEVVVGPLTSFSERVVVTDSSHHHVDPDAWFYHSVKDGPVRFGRNSWVAAGATIARGSTIGDWCVVGANSVVSGDVPDGHMASGIPATCRPLRHAWLERTDHGA